MCAGSDFVSITSVFDASSSVRIARKVPTYTQDMTRCPVPRSRPGSMILVREMLFAKDTVMVALAHSSEDLQAMINLQKQQHNSA